MNEPKDALRCGVSRKICFHKRDAEQKRNYLERRGQEHLRIYQCHECWWWHLTQTLHAEFYNQRTSKSRKLASASAGDRKVSRRVTKKHYHLHNRAERFGKDKQGNKPYNDLTE